MKVEILKSFYDENGKLSSRKLTAFIIIACCVAAHVAWLKKAFLENDFSLLSEILMIDYAFVAALFGLTTYSATRGNLTTGNKTDTPAQ